MSDMNVFGYIKRWIERRAAIRHRWRSDASMLIQQDERNAYYAAQRFAARSRALGDTDEYFHWAKVAAEVARRSSIAEMDFERVKMIVDSELKHQ